MSEHRIAVIPGDGIGREVMPEGVRVMEAAGAKHGIRFHWQEFPWSCDWYKAHGKMCPDDAPQILRQFDAIYFGAVGNPAIVADHISAWGLLINFRRWFDLYVNLRPVRLFEGLPCPLAGRKPGDIDYYVIRENTEGEYGNVGGRMFEGTDREVVTQQAVFSRQGSSRSAWATGRSPLQATQRPSAGRLSEPRRRACRKAGPLCTGRSTPESRWPSATAPASASAVSRSSSRGSTRSMRTSVSAGMRRILSPRPGAIHVHFPEGGSRGPPDLPILDGS